MAWLWSFLAIWYFRPLPGAVATALAVLWACLTLGLFLKLPKSRALRYTIAGCLLVWVIWSLQPPRNDRDWGPDQAQLPQVMMDGDQIIIENVRCASYRSDEDFDVAWERKSFNLKELESVDFVMVPFEASTSLAHVFVSFGFENGEHLAVSVEVRKERNEKYSPLWGLFHRYELMYVIGEESDLIGLRTNLRRRPVYLYPVKATKEQVRHLLLSMLTRADKLRNSPEFYNTVSNACSTNLFWHMNQVRRQPVAWNWRVLVTGFSDELAFDLGLIDFNGSLDEARSRFCIEGRTQPWTQGKTWSRQIREFP